MTIIKVDIDRMDYLKDSIAEDILDGIELDDIEIDFSEFEFKFDYSIDVNINSITLEKKEVKIKKPPN